MTDAKTNQYSTSEINLVTYLNLRNIRPEHYVKEDGRGTLYYERTADLEAAIIDFMQKCSVCGVAFSEVGTAQATARKRPPQGARRSSAVFRPRRATPSDGEPGRIVKVARARDRAGPRRLSMSAAAPRIPLATSGSRRSEQGGTG